MRPSYHTFIEPTRGNADIIVDFTYRRSFFTRLLIHVIKHSVEGGFDMREFLTTVEDESFKPGLRPDEGAMPLVPDIFELAKAFPDTPDIGRVAESLPAAKL